MHGQQNIKIIKPAISDFPLLLNCVGVCVCVCVCGHTHVHPLTYHDSMSANPLSVLETAIKADW